MSADFEKKREETLIVVFSETFGIRILILASLIILSEAGMDTAPLITGESRERIRITFDKEGIEIPFPQRVVHQAVGNKA